MSGLRGWLAVPVTVALAVAGVFAVTGCSGIGKNVASRDFGASGIGPSSAGNDTAAQVVVAAERAGHQWAAAGSAALAPGVQTYTQGGGQCTANYVFVDDAGGVYLGQAAHCAGAGNSAETNGCMAHNLPLDTAVNFTHNGSLHSSGTTIGTGQLAYSSWSTMRALGESDPNTCAYNDFSLVKVDQQFADKVNPSLPHWGGPAGLNTSGTAGGKVYSYGNSSLRAGISGLSPQRGESRADDNSTGGWTHALVSRTPGIPGDSGSAYLAADGQALGTLSTLGIGVPVVNNVGDIGRELAYARAHSGITGLRLVLGTEQFNPNR
ncbi:hypothetical protein [Nocardia sp. CA-145437]|uniref:hypothetical protein n=1 Tax=Nocardia sp. CA-145437 TaxID=3239980 RepID=UPI003D9904AB